MTDQELQARVAQISLKSFHRPFQHVARFNSRLQTTGGRFFPADGHLEFNQKMFAVYDHDETDKIIKHELVHYHLYYEHRGYHHRDATFKTLLAAVGGARYAPPMTTGGKWHYRCRDCQQEITRRRRLDTTRYVCAACRGQLRLVSAANSAK